MSEHPIVHPEIQRLTDENDLLREEYASLLTELEDLIHTVKPNLMSLYQTKIGLWELRLLQAQFQVARLRRQIEMAQASLSRGERPDLIAIECALEQEFLAWVTKLEEAAQRIQSAEERLKHLLSPADDRELKKLYYALVKRFHPDVNPNVTEDQRRLWSRAQSAYEAGDLPELRALALLAEKSASVPPSKSLDSLRRDQKILEEQIATALKRVEQVESQPPFTLRRKLEDEAWLTTRRQEIDAQAATLVQQGDALKTHWEKLSSDTGYGTTFGQN
ncbi:MAG: J domain-containing protein [Verrucomicrobiota bacterium]|jgi:predicted  nucleic acid-binding Zn-ribbon protein